MKKGKRLPLCNFPSRCLHDWSPFPSKKQVAILDGQSKAIAAIIRQHHFRLACGFEPLHLESSSPELPPPLIHPQVPFNPVKAFRSYNVLDLLCIMVHDAVDYQFLTLFHSQVFPSHLGWLHSYTVKLNRSFGGPSARDARFLIREGHWRW